MCLEVCMILNTLFPYRLGYSYDTLGSGFNRTWRLLINPNCGFRVCYRLLRLRLGLELVEEVFFFRLSL